MSSKYAVLEGYDFNQLECYETENTQDINEKSLYNESIEEQQTESIDVSSLKADDALKKFVETEEQQYQQKFDKLSFLTKKKRNQIDVYQSSENENETPAQQLRRLIKEVDALKYRIEKETAATEATTEKNEIVQKDSDGDATMTFNDINNNDTNTNNNNADTNTTSNINTTTSTASATTTTSNINTKSLSTPSSQQPKPSTLLNQITKLQTDLEKMTLGIVDDTTAATATATTTTTLTTTTTTTTTTLENTTTTTDINNLENTLIQQKMLSQIKDCKLNALKDTPTPPEKEEDKKDLMNVDENHQNVNNNVNNNINNESGIDSNCITYQLFYSPNSIKQHRLTRITDLEDRISQIENILGVNNLTDDSILFPSNNRSSMLVYAKGNIVTAIDSLDQQLQLLSQPKSFGNITMKINDTVKELEQFINLQKTKMEGEEKIEELLQLKEKVDALYQKLESTEEYSAIISPLLTRLKTLQTLHTEASQFSESIQMFAERQEAMQASIKTLSEMMQELNQSLQENKTIVENNVESITQRVDQLMERINKL